MKKDIHPKYYKDAITHCSCGKVFKVGSTKQEMHVEICSACHPFYTGQDKIIDTAGRVEKFRKRLAQKKETKKGTPKRGKKVPPVGGIPPDDGKKQNDRKPQ